MYTYIYIYIWYGIPEKVYLKKMFHMWVNQYVWKFRSPGGGE